MPSSKKEIFVKQFINAASDIVNVLAVGTKPVMTFAGFEKAGRDEVATRIGDGIVFHGKYSGNLSAQVLIILTENCAKKLAGSLLGVENPIEFGSSEKSAVFELMNNIMGRWIPIWNQVLAGEIKIAEQELLGRGEKIVLQEDKWYSIVGNCRIDNDDYRIEVFITGEDIDKVESLQDEIAEPVQEVKMAESDKIKDSSSGKESIEGEGLGTPTPARDAQDKGSSQPSGKESGERTVAEPQPITARKATFQQLEDQGKRESFERPIEFILDVPLLISVELGRKDLTIREILELSPGSIIELDQLAGEPVDLMVNGKLFARGEVVVIDENFGVRVTNIISPQERLEKMR